jgi:CMP-N-acetylneuraminic acid synthetase
MATIAVLVNARVKSSRLPRKLLLPFAGTTLIDITLEKLDRMDFFAHRYLGIAEEELLAKATPYRNIEILKRNEDAVAPGYNDHRKVYSHYRDVDADYIFWLNACHPLLSIETVRRCYDEVLKTQKNSYTSVVPTTDWIFDEIGNPITNTKPSMLSTAHSPKFFRVAHAFHVFRKDFFLKDYVPWTLTPGDPALVEIPQEESYDVNDQFEFDIAEGAYRKKLQATQIKQQ